MSSLLIIFDRRKIATKERDGSVEISVSANGMRKYFSTGVRIKINEWRNGMVVNRIDAYKLNAKIQQKYNELYERSNGSEESINQLIGSRLNVCDWMEQTINERADISAQTKRLAFVTLRSLRESGLFKRFSDITPANLKKWDNIIRQHVNKQNAIYNYHKDFKTYLNIAVQQDLINVNPYIRFKVSKGQSDSIKYITEEERRRIELLNLDGTIAIARDMFIFACYTGLADADLRRVSRNDIYEEDGKKYIIDNRRKSGAKYRLVILPKALEILERYDYNLNQLTNQKCNVFLKAIQAMAGIKTNLTMHVGRHTFATWALKRGIRIEVVSKMLAHADIQTTQIYAKVLQEEVDKGFDKLID